MKKILLVVAAISIFNFQFSICQAQTWPVDPVIMEVAGQKVRQSEFMKEFMSSVGDKLAANPQTPEAEKRQALREYVELFANFRAKVADAEALGFDTTATLREELAKYRGELAAPYLIDSAVLEDLLHEAYARNAWSLHCAHILVPVSPDASPADTMAALQRITEFRNRIVAGEDFYAVAQETVKEKDRLDRKVRPDEGNLGYFTAFDMVYPFENAAYALAVGEVSQPVRTRYGYHIIKLFDKVHMQGKVDMAHIWIGRRDSVSGRKTIYEQYERLNRGISFDEVALQSDDHTTYANGGRMMNAALNQLPPEYIHVIENMQPGEYSEPFHTRYGWHIVKLIRRDTLPPYESMVPYYKQRMTRDQRGDASRKVFATKCREKYNVVDLTKTPVPQPVKKGKKKGPVKMQASLDSLYTIVPKNIVMGKWDYDDSLVKDVQTLVRVGDREYNTLDLARYINSHRTADREMKIPYYVNMRFEEFIDSVAVLYANSQLENENPEFAAIVDEYRRGLMIFNYNDKMIWSKAIYDTTGFVDFYNRQSKTKRMTNPADSMYFWKTRARVAILTVSDSSLLAPEKAVKLLTKAQKKNKGSAEMKEILVKAIGKKAPGTDAVHSEIDLVEQGRTTLLAEKQWSNGVYVSPFKKGYHAVVVEEVLPPTLKSRLEARGYYLNEYQNELERNLNSSLREKYNVKINYNVIDSIVY